MSSSFRLPLRERWAAREVILTRSFTAPGGTFRHGDRIAELRIDGVTRELFYTPEAGSDPECGIYWHYVDVGQEVGPWGYLLEYTDWPADRQGPRVVRRPSPIRYRRRDRYPQIFLNYRRDDADLYAGRLHETLVRTFGANEVFMDQFSIRPGEQFPWTIQQAVWHAPVMVSLFGPKWATLRDGNATTSRRRIDSEFDYVRRELTAALDTGTTVIPIVLPGGALPATAGLPIPEMLALQDVQALELSPRHWDADMANVIDAIQTALRETT